MRDIQLKIPFLQAVTDRFLKDLTTNCNKVEGVVNLSKQCGVVLLKKLPLKLDDPYSFFIPISISTLAVNNALCDLGACIGLMPLYLYKRLSNIGSLIQTSITLQLSDLRHPKAIAKDVLVL